MEFYRLAVSDESGTVHAVLGTEEVLRLAFDEIVEAMGAVDGTAKKVLRVAGVLDRGDRSPVELVLRPEHVRFVLLHRY